MIILDHGQEDFQRKLKEFCAPPATAEQIGDGVAAILAQVKERGDDAVIELTEKFDGVRLSREELVVPAEDMAKAERALSDERRKAITEAIRCVEEFHQKGLPKSWEDRNPHGALVGERYFPLERVGVWIPGGSVPLASTVVMTLVLARLAGVPEIAVFTPPGKDGNVNADLLAAISLCGIGEVYRMGGVLAVGAMAYGTDTVKPVCKVFGPGNAYVVEAQRQVFGTIGTALLPGPSEIMVIADETANPAYVAADMMAQAEHGSGKEKVYLVTTKREIIAEVEKEVERQIGSLSHEKQIRTVLDKGCLCVTVPGMEEAAEVANYVAPEHLELQVEETHLDLLLFRIRNAGAILIGSHTPTVLGDFTAGPSHTLPTGRTGRFFSGLKVSDFFRRTSIVRYDKGSVNHARPVVAAFSEMERLDAHGRSLEIRD